MTTLSSYYCCYSRRHARNKVLNHIKYAVYKKKKKKKKKPEPELISYYYLVNLKNLGGLSPQAPPPPLSTPLLSSYYVCPGSGYHNYIALLNLYLAKKQLYIINATVGETGQLERVWITNTQQVKKILCGCGCVAWVWPTN